ncbi:MAG: hypothetical protein Q8867_07390 [Bacteroidota bacterium]|nr:hypothetical protein [Bacteroidota bacterium]
MKKLFLICVVILYSMCGFPQIAARTGSGKELRHFFLDFSGGISLPTGVYSSTDLSRSKAGFASSGFVGQLNLIWMGKKNLGFDIQYCFLHNPYVSGNESVIPEGYNEELGSHGWSNHFFLAGPVYIKPIGKFSIDVLLLGGVIFSSTSFFNEKNPVSGTLNKNVGSGFAYEAGIGLGYNITSRLVVKANLNYMEGFPDVDRQYYLYTPADSTSGTPGYSTVTTHATHKVVSSFNMGAGILFKF